MNKPCQKLRSRAAASFVAVMMVGAVALSLTAVAAVTARQMIGARDASHNAQLRALLVAGAVALPGHQEALGDHGQGVDLPLPEELISQNASITLTRQDGGQTATYLIEARLGKHTATQTVSYPPNGGAVQIHDTVFP